jgi:hypothetical protein
MLFNFFELPLCFQLACCSSPAGAPNFRNKLTFSWEKKRRKNTQKTSVGGLRQTNNKQTNKQTNKQVQPQRYKVEGSVKRDEKEMGDET